MTTQEALERAEQLAQERKELRNAGLARIKELIDKHGTIEFAPFNMRGYSSPVAAVRYGKWRARYIDEPSKDEYLIVFVEYGKRVSWPLDDNVHSPHNAWQVVQAIEDAVSKQ